MNIILLGTLASLVAASATIVGAATVFFLRRVNDKFLDTALGFAAGVMLSAAFFGLLMPALKIGGVWKTSLGVLLGMLFLILIEKAVPHMHRIAGVKGPPTRLSKMSLLVLAITIHNFPEGLSVGVAFAGTNMSSAMALTTGIGIQNLVEGLVISLPLFCRDKNRITEAFLVASATCLVEPLGGFLGASIISLGKFLSAYGLAFAAGAMLFVTSEELIPETHSRGNAREATVGIILGVIVMMVLEYVFAF